MKTFKLKNALMILALGVTAGVFSSCDKDDDIDNRPYTVTGNATGAQMVPSVAGTGTATFSGTYNPSNRVMTYTSNWTGLSGAPSNAGFYTGAAGVNGTAAGTGWSFEPGITGTGTTTGTMTLTTEQASQLTAGNWYYSYGTTANTSGEVRGQLTAVR